jgi:hypothetical protein
MEILNYKTTTNVKKIKFIDYAEKIMVYSNNEILIIDIEKKQNF